MADADKTKVIGKALYLELRKGINTYQLLLTPDGTHEGRNVPGVLYRRQISKITPRKGWKHGGLPAAKQDEFGSFIKKDSAEALADAVVRFTFIESVFNQLSGYGYTIYKQPIVVEVSAEDLQGIRSGKTPYKILGRITRVRRSLGFGEELFEV